MRKREAREKGILQKKGITGENTTGERNTTTEKPLAETGFHHRKTRMTEYLLQKNTAYGRGHEENTWGKNTTAAKLPCRESASVERDLQEEKFFWRKTLLPSTRPFRTLSLPYTNLSVH